MNSVSLTIDVNLDKTNFVEALRAAADEFERNPAEPNTQIAASMGADGKWSYESIPTPRFVYE